MKALVVVMVLSAAVVTLFVQRTEAANPCFSEISDQLNFSVPSVKFGGASYRIDMAYHPAGPTADSNVWFELLTFEPSDLLPECSNPASFFIDSGRITIRTPVVLFSGSILWADLEYVPTTDNRLWVKLSAIGLMPNRVFVTSVEGDGNLGSWPDAEGKTGLEAGDAVCQARAAAAGLTGTFRAWLSDDTSDAYCRVQNLTGKVSDNCGQASLPTAAGPWVRTDGLPFGDTIFQLLENPEPPFGTKTRVLSPPRCDEFGTCVEGGTEFFTATWTDGTLDSSNPSPCGNWTSAERTRVDTGSPDRTSSGWTVASRSFCADSHPLMCFQTGPGAALPVLSTNGKKVFMSSKRGNGNLASWPDSGGKSGIEAGDAVCQSLAAGAGLPNAERFKAWLSIETTSESVNAGDRITTDGPWVRLDGVLVAENKSDLLDGFLFAPINLTEKGLYRGSWIVWTGTMADGRKTEDTCSGWTSASENFLGLTGRPNGADARWSDIAPTKCDFSGAYLYCFED